MKKHLTPLLAGVVMAAVVAGCAETVNTHGQVILPSKLAQIKPGETSREQVLQLLGSPSAQGTMNDGRWYYITSTNGTKALQPNILKARKVVVIDFDPSSTLVTSMVEKSAQDGKEVDPTHKITPTQGQSLGILDQLMGNLGLGPQ